MIVRRIAFNCKPTEFVSQSTQSVSQCVRAPQKKFNKFSYHDFLILNFFEIVYRRNCFQKFLQAKLFTGKVFTGKIKKRKKK